MAPAVAILMLAWTLGALIDELGTGEYLGHLVETTALIAAWLVPHVVTQLPYALLSAVGALLGYVAFALTGSTWLGLVVALAATTALLLGARALAKPLPEAERTAA